MKLIPTTIDLSAPCPNGEPSMTDEMRAERAAQSLLAWRAIDAKCSADEAVSDTGRAAGEYEMVLMLADLRVLADRLGLEFAKLDREAYLDYLATRQQVRFVDARGTRPVFRVPIITGRA